MAQPRTQWFAVAGLVLAVAAAGGYWAYQLYLQSQLRKAAAALVMDTGSRLRTELERALAGAPASAEQRAEIEAHAAAVERNYSELRRLDADAVGALAALADDYILTSREILRRLAIIHRARLDLTASSAALHEHMRSDRGQAAWPGTAVRLRERVDQDYRDYRLAAEALLPLLDTFPASQARIGSHLSPAALIDSSVVTKVRAVTAEATTGLAAHIRRLTDLEAYR